jgi:hypothetical protein
MSVGLSIAFTGLCALVAGNDGGPAEVLLLDANGVGEVGGVRLPAHAPTLLVGLRDLANAEASAPDRVISSTDGEQAGIWDLAGSEVRIRTQGGARSGPRLFQPSPGTSSWPAAPRQAHDPAAWRDLRYVADMKVIAGDGRIDPSLLGAVDVLAGRLPASVAARIQLDEGQLEAGMPSQEIHRNDVFEFSAAGSPRRHRQALTDTIRWTLRAAAAAVVIEIVPVDGRPARRLLLAPSATPHCLFVSNLPAENTAHAAAHDTLNDEAMSALHFGAFYRLLVQPSDAVYLPTPWRAARRARGAGGIRSVFCPPAMFTRQ